MVQHFDTASDLSAARAQIWADYQSQLQNNSERRKEFDNRELIYGDISMRFYMTIKGQPDKNGYPVYIALHGGGGCPFPQLNDSQWKHQETYYFNSVSNGICIAPRGIRDTWNTHFNEESYPLYDRLLADLAVFEPEADMNRVYLLGFSAGGDGVYGITPYMADRFAAANMSAGHPNEIDLSNLYNLPLELQVGECDRAYDRNYVTARYGLYLDELAKTYHGGFEHQVFIHYQKPHNFRDNEPSRAPQTVLADYHAWLDDNCIDTIETNTNAIDFVNRYRRNPLPERVVWNLEKRAAYRDVHSHYWLSADPSVQGGKLVASYNKTANSVTIENSSVHGTLKILVNEDMLDLFSPITVCLPDRSFSVLVTPDIEKIHQTTLERGDKNYQFCAEIAVEL